MTERRKPSSTDELERITRKLVEDRNFQSDLVGKIGKMH